MPIPHDISAYGEPLQVIKEYARLQNPSSIQVVNVHEDAGICLYEHSDYWSHFWERIHLSDFFFQQMTLFTFISDHPDEETAKSGDGYFDENVDYYYCIDSTLNGFYFCDAPPEERFGYIAREILSTQVELLGIHQNKITYIEKPGGSDAGVARTQGFQVFDTIKNPSERTIEIFFDALCQALGRSDEKIIKAMANFDESTIKSVEFQKVQQHFEDWIAHLGKRYEQIPVNYKAALYDMLKGPEKRPCLRAAILKKADCVNRICFHMKKNQQDVDFALAMCAQEGVGLSKDDIDFAYYWALETGISEKSKALKDKYNAENTMLAKTHKPNKSQFFKNNPLGVRTPKTAGKKSFQPKNTYKKS